MADDLLLSDDHVLFRDALSAFVDREIAPVADALDEKESFPRELFQRLAELGYLGVRFPAEYGGSGDDNMMYTLLCEELAPRVAEPRRVRGRSDVLGYHADSPQRQRRSETPIPPGGGSRRKDRCLGCLRTWSW